MIATILP